MKNKPLSDNNNPIAVFWKKHIKKNPMEQHFKINGATSAVKSVNTVCAKIHSDVRLSNISVHPITSNLLQ